jgi:acetyl-CoA synthetase
MTDFIVKDPAKTHRYNLGDYAAVRSSFNWDKAKGLLTLLPGGGMNIAYEALDRHVDEGHGSDVALRWLSKSGDQQDFSYQDLSLKTARFANVLKSLGVVEGDSVFGLCSRVPNLYISLLGTLKYGAVFSPLFSAFGPDPIRSRMTIGRARVLVTSQALYKKKIAPWRAKLPSLTHVLLYEIKSPLDEGCLDLDQLLEGAKETFTTRSCSPEALALLHFTSGTTGQPKGAMHVHQAALYHKVSGQLALDLHPGDIFWCTADPGWVTGTSYGVISPLCNRATLIIDEQEFDAEHWYQLLAEQKVKIWYTAPTAIRMLMKSGDQLPRQYDLSELRFMASVGEPLNPEAILWGQRVLGMPFHDNWWQSETGGIMVANFASQTVKPGSMGQAMPGVNIAIATRRGDGEVEIITEPGIVGELAIKSGWPSMFRGYLNEEARYQKCFSQGWYFSGDLATCDDEGYFWFIGRTDDVIKSSGHLIGPFEVESVLIEHPAVAEAAVIGLPDDVAGELVKAFVALQPGAKDDDETRQSIMAHARKRLGAAVAPREILFRRNLPKTRSGKIMRRLLKTRELGLPQGDISTLESDES